VPILFLLFVVTPFVELWLLLRVGAQIGSGMTIGLVILTGFIGANLARREGFKVMREFQHLSSQGVMPGEAMLDGLAVFLGGALLLTPGFITDVIGFLLLVPTSRALMKVAVFGWLRRKLEMRQVVINRPDLGAQGSRRPPAGPVIDQQFEDKD